MTRKGSVGYCIFKVWWLLKEPLFFGGKPSQRVYLLLVYLTRKGSVGYCIFKVWCLLKEPLFFGGKPSQRVYLLLVYLVTALVPSLTACFASSPGRSSLMAVWISRELMVDFLL